MELLSGKNERSGAKVHQWLVVGRRHHTRSDKGNVSPI